VTDRPIIEVVGLGPGDERFITEHTRSVLAAIPHRFLRTARHPSAHVVVDGESFDHIYESADTFADVYATIVDLLVAAAAEHRHIVYAVPGSPLILERTVADLRADPRVTTVVHPAMSFLDLVWPALGIDPIESRVRLVDGHDFATAAAADSGPLLIAHTHADWVLSEIKLAVEDATGDEPVVILQALGTTDQQVTHTTWADLDRTVVADHLTSVYVPALGAPVGHELVRFHQLARTLREQCPWDQEQTHRTLVTYLLEEAYEVVDAIDALDSDLPSTDDDLLEELGDLLYQVEFHAVIAEQEGRFTMADVARHVHDKLVRRHPHVFGDVVVDDADEVKRNWDAIKATEKQRTSVFDGVPRSQAALGYAAALQGKARKVGFDWPDVVGAFPKIAEETDELAEAMASGDTDQVEAELGDLLFAVVNVARHLHVEPELALRGAADRFRTRFAGVERLAAERNLVLREADLTVLDALWDEVKIAERSGQSRP
jgi:tetrapyrrole methylase family protein / MazG family protein